MADLSVEKIEGARPERAIAFLHGILGRGINLKTLATRFVDQRPEWSAWLVDLRGHGRSPKGTPGASLEAAALDVVDLAKRNELPLAAIAGHSFGGKAALEAARIGNITSLKDVVVIDSMPGAREPLEGADSALGIIKTIEYVKGTLTSIAEWVEALEKRGLPRHMAQWLAGSLRFGMDFQEIRALLKDYFARDLWSVVEKPPGETRVHLVIGDQSDAYSATDRARALRIAALNPRITVNVLPAGHWVHVDDLEGLLRVMAGFL
jgi:esterase